MLTLLYARAFRLAVPAVVKAGNALPGGPRLTVENPRIDHGYKMVHVHVPKTGGTSVTKAMEALPEQPSDHGLRPVRLKFAKHVDARRLRSLLGVELWDEYHSFAVVRNPWDLAVSSYHYLQQHGSQFRVLRSSTKQASRQSFKEFVMAPPSRRTIMDQLCDESGNVIVDRLIRFEALDDGWREVCEHVGAPYSPLGRLNPSERGDYREYYDDETVEVIAGRFRGLIEHSGYTFD